MTGGNDTAAAGAAGCSGPPRRARPRRRVGPEHDQSNVLGSGRGAWCDPVDLRQRIRPRTGAMRPRRPAREGCSCRSVGWLSRQSGRGRRARRRRCLRLLIGRACGREGCSGGGGGAGSGGRSGWGVTVCTVAGARGLSPESQQRGGGRALRSSGGHGARPDHRMLMFTGGAAGSRRTSSVRWGSARHGPEARPQVCALAAPRRAMV